MNRRSISLAASFLLMLASARAETLDQVLGHLDENAKTFKSFTANFTFKDTTAVLGSAGDDIEKGGVSFEKVKDALIGKLNYEDGHLAVFDGKTFRSYAPKANQVDIYEMGKDTSQFGKLLLLGFATSRADLMKDFDSSLGGPATIDGQATTRIVLKPKTDQLKKLMDHVELWIPEGKGYPIQEKITEPSNNTKTFTYSSMKIPAPAGTMFEANIPANAKKVYPGK
jgi:outer membrane lipoprotein-sorting protein